MLFAGWEVRIAKNCDRGLENAFLSPMSQFFTIQTDVKPVNNLFIFCQALKRKKTHVSVTVTVVRERKIRTALRTNQIVEFVTVPAWRKIIFEICFFLALILLLLCSIIKDGMYDVTSTQNSLTFNF